jgi:hypothetical protein
MAAPYLRVSNNIDELVITSAAGWRSVMDFAQRAIDLARQNVVEEI